MSSMSVSRWFGLLLALFVAGCNQKNGIVVDAHSRQPINNATVFHNGKVTRSNEKGEFRVKGVDWTQPVFVKAPGFRQKQNSIRKDVAFEVDLQPFDAKAIYLSYFGIAAPVLRDPAFNLIEETSLNAVVIDVKDDRGFVSFNCPIPEIRNVGIVPKPSIADIDKLLAELHKKNIYVIARIAVFRDELLAQTKPDWTIVDEGSGQPFKEKGKVAWLDPFRKEIWEYNIAVAKAAAEAGFDEIQFDYVRFPATDHSALKYAKSCNDRTRSKAINGFLKQAYRELLPFNVYVAADVFGITCWHDNDCGIGQPMRQLAETVDYLCPMVYPSGFTGNVLGMRGKPTHFPGEVVSRSMRSAAVLIGGNSKKLRPWLQNFKDYAYDKRDLTARDIALQVQACYDTATSGWMLWDASNKFKQTAEALNSVDNLMSTNAVAENSSPPPHAGE
jgi:hypothetical protein